MTASNIFKRNIVYIVMVPFILGSHWGWRKLQNVDALVSEEERQDLPITIGWRYLLSSFSKKDEEKK